MRGAVSLFNSSNSDGHSIKPMSGANTWRGTSRRRGIKVRLPPV